MDCLERNLNGNWANGIAIRLVDAAVAASAHLLCADRESLLREIAKRALWHLTNRTVELRNAATESGLEIPDQPSKGRSPNKSAYSHASDRLESDRAA
jgi:hypothetical protein